MQAILKVLKYILNKGESTLIEPMLIEREIKNFDAVYAAKLVTKVLEGCQGKLLAVGDEESYFIYSVTDLENY